MTTQQWCAYLPYKIQGVSTDENVGIETVIGINIGHGYAELNTNHDAIDISMFKPLLRPLSSLTQPITVDGETTSYWKLLQKEFYNIDWNFIEAPFNIGLFLDSNSGVSFGLSLSEMIDIINWLLKHHFNVFNLPETDYIKIQD